MLEPHDRRLLLESLRPPDGYALDCAIGTTFSLDLLALLTAPLAFTLFDWEDSTQQSTPDPLALLEAIRRHADRLSIFCQAGQIAIPRTSQILYGYLEQSVFEVAAPREQGVFHPKLWVLRFAAEGSPVLYRLLCLSRNLTFDRAWDTVLVLEGMLVERQRGFGVNNPLGEFIAALPRLALRPVPNRAQASADLIQSELRRVRFEPPPGFDELSFHPLGIYRSPQWPFAGRIDRLLVVSPFVSAGCLNRLTELGGQHVLISRPESLEPVSGGAIKRFERIYTLSERADGEPAEGDAAEEKGVSETDDLPLTGLHAKLYVADQGWHARVWTGSANATDAAFNSNVEFLISLKGKRRYCGVDAVLSNSQGSTDLIDLLEPFTPASMPVAVDRVQEWLEQRVEEARRALAKAKLLAQVVPVDGGTEFRLRIHNPRQALLELPPGVQARCWPITLREETAASLVAGAALAEFPRLSLEALTSFFGFVVTAAEGEKHACARFVLNLPLEGAPVDRQERILRSLLSDRARVLRFLLLLLSEEAVEASAALLGTSPGRNGADGDGGYSAGVPLFEALVRALHRHPERLDHVARLVEDLRQSPEGEQLLPEGFDKVWQPIWTARGRLVS